MKCKKCGKYNGKYFCQTCRTPFCGYHRPKGTECPFCEKVEKTEHENVIKKEIVATKNETVVKKPSFWKRIFKRTSSSE